MLPWETGWAAIGSGELLDVHLWALSHSQGWSGCSLGGCLLQSALTRVDDCVLKSALMRVDDCSLQSAGLG